MNKERMLKLADFIEALPPKQFNMQFWAVNNNNVSGRRDVDPKTINPHQCGTTACIAGWAVYLFAKRDPVDQNYWISFGEEAQDLLGLTLDQRENLFLSDCWGEAPEHITREMAAAKIRKMVASGF
jgi:hypothetical protein